MQNFKPLAIFCGRTARFVSDLVGNTEGRFSHDAAHQIPSPFIFFVDFLVKWLPNNFVFYSFYFIYLIAIINNCVKVLLCFSSVLFLFVNRSLKSFAI